MLQRLLNYWYSLEFFQPSWPVREKEDHNLFKEELPWLQLKSNPDKQISYDIYFGCGIAYDLIAWILAKLGLDEEDSPIERDHSKVCLCALKLDANGVYVENSFAVSSFVWALGAMSRANDFNVKLDKDALEKFQAQYNSAFCEKEKSFMLDELKSVFGQVCAGAGVEDSNFSPALWARIKVQNRKKDGSFPVLDPGTELMPSFFLRDLDKIMKEPGMNVARYVEALRGAPEIRVRVDNDVNSMKTWLKANRFPQGTWPSRHSPSLMQQLAINLGVSGQAIFSVNGPPGTGKTTLLKEIIVCNIVMRAAMMAKYSSPDEAFKKEKFKDPPDEYNQYFYIPDNSLTAYAMLVASNNNAAVENISLELPKAVEKDRTGYFSNIKENSETYFSDIAAALLGEPAWGLISARLGKRENINKLKNRLWWASDGATLKQYYDQNNPPDWESARKAFFTAWEAVVTEQANIAETQNLVEKCSQSIESERIGLAERERLCVELENRNHLNEECQSGLKRLEDALVLHRQNINLLKSSLSLFKRLLPFLYKKDSLVQEWKRTELMYSDTLISITRQRLALNTCAGSLYTIKRQLREIEESLVNARKEKNYYEELLEQAKKRYGDSFADENFWADIQKNEVSQSACPWTDMVYDTLREELFYRALMLQKAFILGSNSVKQNLTRLFNMWDGNFSVKDRDVSYGSLLNTLFFVIPVISTTFASVQSFLEGIQPGELGILVVDEAGQATPHSALGAIWRTRKVIAVGDPLQIEPIMTTPLELCNRFAEEYAIPNVYKIPALSVQCLADAINPYGGLRRMNDEQIWIGCPLVIHRRCIEPMFGMSNKIAYNDSMICKTASPSADKLFLLKESIWFDVPGREAGKKDHTVTGQIDLAARLMEEAIIKYNSGREDFYDKLPDLYIISPFKSVTRSLRNRLHPMTRKLLPGLEAADIDKWFDENCGTIHTFQGKEANEVLLVLGCDGQMGISAARWVGLKPNIINVAVSRAKNRIGVIGDYNLWREIPYVQVVCDMLKDSIVLMR